MASSMSPRPMRSALKQTPSTPASPTQTPPRPLPLALSKLQDSPPDPRSAVDASGYTTKVSFDTFTATADVMFSFTLQTKSDGYKKTRNTRGYLCAASGDPNGMHALDWTLENLVEDGDELVAVRGFELSDLRNDMHEELKEEAKGLMRHILEKNSDVEGRKLSVIVEFVAGKVTETIERMTALYRPDSLIVGTSGQRRRMSTWGAALGKTNIGSVSRYCVSRSPVPVIVVQPEDAVQKAMAKRRADPKRRAQFDKLTKTKSLSAAS